MTAEIVIMNKEAIALASDSAVTLSEADDSKKIFPSANKIFSLSKYNPIGVMIYGNGSFMGIPWETIIKTYRSQLGTDTFDTLKQQANDFLNYLQDNRDLFNDKIQGVYFINRIYSFLYYIRERIKISIHNYIDSEGEINEGKIIELTQKIINEIYQMHKGTLKLESYSKTNIEIIKEKYKKIILDAKKEVFENLPLTSASSRKINTMIYELHFKDVFNSHDTSGIVFAGFGNNEYFPCVISYSIDSIVNNTIKYKLERVAENTATIIPFAQQEMVHSFMQGVQEDYHILVMNLFDDALKIYSEEILKSIKISVDERKKLSTKLKGFRERIMESYHRELLEFREVNFIEPVMKVVSLAPKSVLAEIAEALVSLTSFKRKISWAEETVGGPIDVAIISKGDGMVWIKRKHYFKPELNHHFFNNYFRREIDEKS